MSGSIVARDQAAVLEQPFLFSDLPADVLKRLEDQEARGQWTGERLSQRKPEVYGIVIRMLAGEFPVESIASLCSVSENTVRGIREREHRPIEECKKRMVGKLVIAKERLIDRVIQAAPEMEGRDAAVALGIVSDKLALETGAPTHRIEINDTRNVDEYRKWMDSLIDVTPIGLLGDAGLQTREVAAASPNEPTEPRLSEGHPPAVADAISDVSPMAVHSATGHATTKAASEGGGGGPGISAGGATNDTSGAPEILGKGVHPPP